MREVLVVCEGQTEREFCRTVVSPQLAAAGVSLAGTLVGKPQRKRGGIREWSVYRSELLRLASERNDRIVSVLVDFYRMPDSWPGRIDAAQRPAAERGSFVEASLRADLAADVADRFVPCVQLHEFESLLFVNVEATASALAGVTRIQSAQLAALLEQIRKECGGEPQLINDGPETAPSKRLQQIVPGYDKVAWGVLAAVQAGVNPLRAGCQWLERWLQSLEQHGTMS